MDRVAYHKLASLENRLASLEARLSSFVQRTASPSSGIQEDINLWNDPEKVEMMMKNPPPWAHKVHEGDFFYTLENGRVEDILKVTKILANGWKAKFDVLGLIPHPQAKGSLMPNGDDVKHKGLIGLFSDKTPRHTVGLIDLSRPHLGVAQGITFKPYVRWSRMASPVHPYSIGFANTVKLMLTHDYKSKTSSWSWSTHENVLTGTTVIGEMFTKHLVVTFMFNQDQMTATLMAQYDGNKKTRRTFSLNHGEDETEMSEYVLQLLSDIKSGRTSHWQ